MLPSWVLNKEVITYSYYEVIWKMPLSNGGGHII